jgi:Tol biopolymer transport system component
MFSRCLLVCLLLAAVLLAPEGGFAAEAPSGPRLATVTLTEVRSPEGDGAAASRLALKTLGPSGAQPQTLLRGLLEGGAIRPAPFDSPSWSADGSLLAFTGISGKVRRIYAIGADGSGLHAVPGTRNGGEPVLSPDGHTIAFDRIRFRSHIDVRNPLKTRFYASSTTWVADLDRGDPRRLTRWRNGLGNTPGSFSPDGTILALTTEDDRLDGPRVTLAPLAGGAPAELVQLATEPAFSPDGSRIAYIGFGDGDVVHADEDKDYRAGELYTVRSDGTDPTRLTRSKGIVESHPSWDPSGQRLAYVRARGSTGFVPELDQLFPLGNAIAEINADGSCNRIVYSKPRVALYGVAWQPGAGREAGPIAC